MPDLSSDELRVILKEGNRQLIKFRDTTTPLEKGQSEDIVCVCEISTVGLQQLQEVLPSVQAGASEAGVNFDLLQRKRRLVVTAEAFSDDTDVHRQMWVDMAVCWLLVLLWHTVPAEQQAKYESWDVLRAAVAAHVG
jgi:hypothetical protein